MNSSNTNIFRHIKTNTLFRHLDGNKYRNLSSGTEGEVSPEIAKNIFAISLDATELCNEYPQVERLILALGMKIENKNT